MKVELISHDSVDGTEANPESQLPAVAREESEDEEEIMVIDV